MDPSRTINGLQQFKLDDAHFAVAELDQMLESAGFLDEVGGKLSLKERFLYAQVPVHTRTAALVEELLD